MFLNVILMEATIIRNAKVVGHSVGVLMEMERKLLPLDSLEIQNVTNQVHHLAIYLISFPQLSSYNKFRHDPNFANVPFFEIGKYHGH